MKHIQRLLLLPVVFLATCMVANPLYAVNQQASATFVNANGKQIGTATLTQTPSGVLIDIKAEGIPAGTHALHIHETGKCNAPDFESAGDHYNPAGAKHGFVNGSDRHAGDLPNQFVQNDGVLQAHVLAPQVTLGTGQTTLFDPDGSALVLHTKADDYTSQPAGEAGDRFACAVIMQR
jgi:Cu-Zn family superoxide dismutase